jgi:putative PIN family toxin of toxin-antitoxin system
LHLVVSKEIRAEYFRVEFSPSVIRLFERHGVSTQRYAGLVAAILSTSQMVAPTGVPPECRDEKDRIYLHCAICGPVDYLVTNDSDLLDIGAIGTIPILSPGQTLSALNTVGAELVD